MNGRDGERTRAVYFRLQTLRTFYIQSARSIIASCTRQSHPSRWTHCLRMLQSGNAASANHRAVSSIPKALSMLPRSVERTGWRRTLQGTSVQGVCPWPTSSSTAAEPIKNTASTICSTGASTWSVSRGAPPSCARSCASPRGDSEISPYRQK